MRETWSCSAPSSSTAAPTARCAPPRTAAARLLTPGGAWVNITECTFTDNGVGLFYNSTGSSASDDRFFDNTFTGNGTAVLLMNVPTDLTLYFDGSTFSSNGTDIDNQCGHPIDTSNAIFE